MTDADNAPLRRAAMIVALANLGYFGVEFAVASASARCRCSPTASTSSRTPRSPADPAGARLVAHGPRPGGLALSAIILVPGLATLWTAWQKFMAREPLALSLAGLGALAVNLGCALLLAWVRHHRSSLGKAAFLSARNDAIANVAIIAAGLVTAFLWRSAWPDLIVGLAIAAINADAAHEVWEAAREEGKAAA